MVYHVSTCTKFKLTLPTCTPLLLQIIKFIMYTYKASLKISLTSLHLNSFKIYKEYSSKYLGWEYPNPAWLVTYDVVEDETVVDMAVSIHRDVHSSAVLHGMLLRNWSQDVGLCVRSSWKLRLLVINVQQLNKDCDGVF